LFVAIVGVVGLWVCRSFASVVGRWIVGRGFASVVGLWVGRVNAVGRWLVGRVRAVGRSVNAVGRCIVGREKAVGRKPPTRLPPKGLAPKPPK